MFQIIARQVECHGSNHQVRHHSLHLQVQKLNNVLHCSGQIATLPKNTVEMYRLLDKQRRTLCLHARLIEVNGRMTEKIQDLEKTVNGFKSDQYQLGGRYAPVPIVLISPRSKPTSLSSRPSSTEHSPARAKRTQEKEA